MRYIYLSVNLAKAAVSWKVVRGQENEKKNTHWELIEQNLAEFSEGKITNSKAAHLLIYE